MTSSPFEAVVIGGSAGAVEALMQILPALPENYPLPVIVVVHVPPDKKSILSEVLNAKCRVKVQEAEDKEPLRPGNVYLAPPNYHLQVETGRFLSLSNEEAVLFSRPSIDVLFETAAEAYREKLVGVILTGASIDGAEGLKYVTDAGGLGLVQNPQEAHAKTMPSAALEKSPQARALSLEKIINLLKEVAAL